jgi:hypothetical protein
LGRGHGPDKLPGTSAVPASGSGGNLCAAASRSVLVVGLALGPGCVGEFLPGNGRVIHQTTLGDGEHGHAMFVFARSRRIALTDTGTGIGPGRTDAGICRGGDYDSTGIGAELKITGGKSPSPLCP